MSDLKEKYLDFLLKLYDKVTHGENQFGLHSYLVESGIDTYVRTLLVEGGIIKNEGTRRVPKWVWKSIHPNYQMVDELFERLNKTKTTEYAIPVIRSTMNLDEKNQKEARISEFKSFLKTEKLIQMDRLKMAHKLSDADLDEKINEFVEKKVSWGEDGKWKDSNDMAKNFEFWLGKNTSIEKVSKGKNMDTDDFFIKLIKTFPDHSYNELKDLINRWFYLNLN